MGYCRSEWNWIAYRCCFCSHALVAPFSFVQNKGNKAERERTKTKHRRKMMIIWIYRNYIFISWSLRVSMLKPELVSFGVIIIGGYLLASTCLSRSLRSIRRSMDQNELSRFIRNGYKTKMQIRHAKSSRLFCETWNKIVILQRAKYLLTVNSFPEIYYYYYFVWLFCLTTRVEWLVSLWPRAPDHVDCCHCQRSIDLICSDAKLALSLCNTNEMPMKPIKFCCCLLFYVIRFLFVVFLLFFSLSFLQTVSTGNVTSNVYH